MVGIRLRGVALVCVLLIPAGCSGSSSEGSPPADVSETPADPSPTEEVLEGGLEPRPDLPELEDGEVTGCIPLCGPAGLTVPGPLPANEVYQTELFFGGYMTFTPTVDGWQGLEDSNGELKIFPPDGGDYGVSFSLDLFPVRGEKPVKPVPTSIDEWIDWYEANPSLETSNVSKTKIGDVPATRIDITTSKTAENDDPGCPADACVNVWSFAHWDFFNGIAGNDIYRQYLAEVTYGGKAHILSAIVETRDAADLKTVAPVVEDLLRTVTLPVARG